MGGEWSTIGAISQVYDGPHATPKKIDVGPYFLSISSLENGKLDLSKSARINGEQFKKWTKRVTPREGDVLFSYETRLGEAALMPRGITACLGRRMGLLRPDTSKVDPRFLLFAYLGQAFQQEIRTRTNYGATVERIALKELPDFPIQIPSLLKQKAIAHILGSLDDKIELNRKMNATLEAMAQALFKSWFVDFDPVIDNALAAGNPIPETLHARAETRKALSDKRKPLPAAIQQQFPSSFVLSEEMGWIPEGWEVSSLGDVCRRITDGAHASPKSVDSGYPMASVKDMHNWGFDVKGCRKISDDDYRQLVKNNCRPIKNDVLIAKDGSYLKHIFVVEEDLEMVLLSSIAILQPNDLINPHFLSFTLKRKDVLERMKNYVSGAVLQRIILKDFRQFEIVLPPSDIQQVWYGIVGSSIDKCWANIHKNETLSKLRDTLLPKLLSGQLRIPDAEALIAELS
jgi:type I restriction enzyme S subunit